jgi:hypothetical protein
MEGRSLRPLIEGSELPPLPAYYTTMKYDIVRGTRWKYRLEKASAGDESGRERLFDIINDPLEEHDVAHLHPDIVEEMRAQHREFFRGLEGRASRFGVSETVEREPADQEELERLEALGYVTD